MNKIKPYREGRKPRLIIEEYRRKERMKSTLITILIVILGLISCYIVLWLFNGYRDTMSEINRNYYCEVTTDRGQCDKLSEKYNE